MPGEPQPPEEISKTTQPDKRHELPLGAASREQVRPAERPTSLVSEKREEEARTTAKETAETRNKLTQLSESHADTSSQHPSTPDPKKRLEEFEAFQEQLKTKREELLGPEIPSFGDKYIWDHISPDTKIGSMLWAARKGSKNFTRLLPDMIQRIGSLGKKESLKEESVKMTVVDRNDFITDKRYSEFFDFEKNPQNKEPLENFLKREISAEVGAANFLMTEGLTVAQYHSFVRQFGHSPFAFWSDDRGENAGRISIDNVLPQDGKHPLADLQPGDPDYESEKALYQPVFPGLTRLPYIGKWRMSRTHSVAFAVKNAEGKDVLLLPAHMDARNAVVFWRDLVDKLTGKKQEGRGALAYHQMHTGQKNYVGTGLYDLGIKNFLRLSREHQGSVGQLQIDGEDKLQTTGTIVGDDRVTWQINDLVKGKM